MSVRRALAPFALAAVATLVVVAGASADSPRVYLSWKAPYGRPGASPSLVVPCDGKNAADTLYLSFETGRDAPTFFGIGARLEIRPAPGDTLGPLWSFGGGPTNKRNVWVEWLEPRHAGFVLPFRAPGQGLVGYERKPEVGKLALSYSPNADSTSAVRDSVRYDFARVVFPRGAPGQAKCDQPIRIEWAWSDFAYGIGEPAVEEKLGGQTVVSWNDPKGVALARPDTLAGAKPATAAAGHAKKKKTPRAR